MSLSGDVPPIARQSADVKELTKLPVVSIPQLYAIIAEKLELEEELRELELELRLLLELLRDELLLELELRLLLELLLELEL